MKLYVDDDSVHELLLRLLQRAGHDIEVPSDVGLVGRSDPVHLRYSISSSRSLLTANHDDFEELHDLVLQAGGTHPGILIVRRDNDRRRDLTPRGIITAIAHLLAADVPVENEFIVLNQWR
jgi:predicted nuclease of predicted toxin-antitoxin system